MISVIDENKYNIALICEVKKHTDPKKLKKIAKSLKILEIEDIKEFSELKVKILKDDKEEEKKIEIKIIAPVVGYKNYVEDIKKPNSIANDEDEFGGENNSSTNDNEEEEKQIDSSDFSADE